jgi:hypothetical protein
MIFEISSALDIFRIRLDLFAAFCALLPKTPPIVVLLGPAPALLLFSNPLLNFGGRSN